MARGRSGFTLQEMLAVMAVALVASVLLLGGCARARYVQMPHLEPPVSVVSAETTGDADPDPYEPLPVARERPVLSLERPRYSVGAVSSRPDAIGRLDVPLTRDWRYIVIHHSFTRAGSEEVFDRYHKQKGWLGVGYHFVIGNGQGSPDGAVEVTFRWERQLHGAHAGVKEYNEHGVGICLVGDFEESYPTARQMRSLVSLVNYLQERCRIPTSGLLLHRHLKNTRCPGRNFPFYEFASLLEH